MNKHIINPERSGQYTLNNRAKIHFSILFSIVVGIVYSLLSSQPAYIAVVLCILGIVGVQLLPKELNELRTERKDNVDSRLPFFILQMSIYSCS